MTDGRDQGSALLPECGTGNGDRTAAATFIRFTKFHFSAFNANGPAVSDLNCNRGNKELNFNIFCECRFNLLFNCRHLSTRSPVKNSHLGPKASGDSGGTDGAVSTTDDNDFIPQFNHRPEMDHIEEPDTADHIIGFFTFQSESEFPVGTNTDEEGIKLILQCVQAPVITDDGIADDLNPHLTDCRHLCIKNRTGQFVGGYTVA